jgi:hypothetical protein
MTTAPDATDDHDEDSGPTAMTTTRGRPDDHGATAFATTAPWWRRR